MFSPDKIKKILIITNIPNPYRIPLFNEMNKQLNDRNIRLKVLFGSLGYPRRKWKVDMSECQFDYEVLSSRKLTLASPEKVTFTYGGLFRIIRKENPSVIITVGYSLATMKLWLMSFFSLPPYFIWSGSTSSKGRSHSYLRKLQRKILISRAAGFIAYGTKAKDYLINLGASENKIQINFNTTDTHYYRTETRRIREKLKNKNKKRQLLYIGHITKGKRLDLLLYIIKKLLNRRQDFIFNLVGSGPEMEDIKILTKNLKISHYVRFEGFKQKKDIPIYLAQADCFLFPSEYDIWGLVLVEAMAAGLPCIASIHAGATHDLIKEGVTGFAMDFSQIEKVVDKINWILENAELARKIGSNASRFVVENLSLEKSATGFVNAIKRL